VSVIAFTVAFDDDDDDDDAVKRMMLDSMFEVARTSRDAPLINRCNRYRV